MAAPIRYLDPASISFSRAAGAAHLRAELKDELCIVETRIKRAFPFSASKNYLSIQDASGRELGIVSDVEALDETSKRLVNEELDRRYFTPKISGISSLKNDGGMWTFIVVTQRGAAEFYVRNWRDSAHEIGPGRIQIHSVDGRRFEIPDYEALDIKSKGLMDQLF